MKKSPMVLKMLPIILEYSWILGPTYYSQNYASNLTGPSCTRAGWPHYSGDFVRYRYVQGGHIIGVILCGTDACRVATLQG